MATIQSVKDKIQGLIDKSNEATGGSDTDLTTAIDNLIANQGGGEVPREKAVNFWDYDGTLLYSYTLAEARALTSLPPLPIYEDERFYAYTWSKTLEQIQSVVGFCDVVPYYKPTDTIYTGCYLFVIDTSKTSNGVISMNVYKNTSSNNAIIDWGDGTTTTISSTSQISISHTYAKLKKYTIAVLATSTIYGGNSSSAMFSPAQVLAAVRASFSPSKYAFSACYNLKFASLGSTGANYLFNSCYGLRLIIGESLNQNNIRNNCYSLERACITYASGTNFENNNNLTKLMLTATNSIYSVPPTLKILFLTATSMCTYNAKITVGTLIYVNDNLVDSYKSATGWVEHANYIYPISSYTDE